MLFIVSGPVTSILVDTQYTSATISWNEPQYIPANYPIVTYEVGYYVTNDSSCNATITGNMMSEGLRNTTLLTATLDDLISNRCYGVVVRSYTEIGPGPWTGIMVRTPEPPTSTSLSFTTTSVGMYEYM